MVESKTPIPQIIPPRPAKETLPTMYDLPSDDPEEPGLPDEYHDLQPELLSRTCCSTHYPPQRIFTGTDINLYYDVHHSRWYKRPDWFLVVDVSRLYEGTDLRASYVVWQEGVNPFVVVELLSPGTAKEDLGENMAVEPEDEGLDLLPDTPEDQLPEETSSNGQLKETPPRKWQVYERILRVPYYVVFSRYTNRVRFFQLIGGHYQEQAVDSAQPQIWIPELELGLGLWQGEFRGIERQWLRWYDNQGNWIPTDEERAMVAEAQLERERQERELAQARAEQEAQRAQQAELLLEQERREKERLLERLRQLEGNSDQTI